MQNHIEALSQKIVQEKSEVHKETNTINIFILPFSERGKKWLLMNSIGFKRNIETLSDISSFGDQLREAAKLMLRRKG